MIDGEWLHRSWLNYNRLFLNSGFVHAEADWPKEVRISQNTRKLGEGSDIVAAIV